MSSFSTIVRPQSRSPKSSGITINENIDVPSWVVDHPSFRKWACSDDFPRRGRFAYLGDHLWINVMGEELFTHNIVKTEFTSVVAAICKRKKLGYVFSDRALLTNPSITLSTEPDLVFASFGRVRAGKVAFTRSDGEREIEISGSPDMVLEVVSKTSVKKDTILLRAHYWLTGIPEYWLVDARTKEPEFQILKRGSKDYSEVRKQSGGWVKSTVLGAELRLVTTKDEFGRPEYGLETR